MKCVLLSKYSEFWCLSQKLCQENCKYKSSHNFGGPISEILKTIGLDQPLFN